ncbi:MAG: hypothetical protein PHP11_03105 [Erysipelotrichaceae bacterium]|nr:hypothetical protein [Erysipelotrichaceae bacterium]MDD3924069.1 hypothetical protein [Erysipelotrichaceae bacterium]
MIIIIQVIKKILVTSLVTFLIFLSLTGCQKTDDEQIYITFARTSDSLKTKVYEFNIDDEEVNLVGQFAYNAQYPLGVYSRENNKMYYSAKAVSGHGDQLWEYDIETEERIQLTDDIYGINDIVPIDDSIYLVAWCYDNPDGALCFYRYDINDKSLELIFDDLNFNVGVLSYSPENDEFMFAGDDVVEMNRRFEISSDEEPFYFVANDVYSMKDNEIKLVFSTEDNEDVSSLAMNDKYIFYRIRSFAWTLYEDGSNSVKDIRRVYLMNRETNEKTEITDEIFNSIGKFIYLTNNDDLYCIYVSDGYIRLAVVNLHDLDNIKTIEKVPSDGYAINNGVALN